MEYPFINIHTHARTGEGIEVVSAMALSGTLPARPCSVGIHPWQVGRVDVEAALHEVATAPVSAIGEIGLDYSRPIPHTLQAEVFEAQLRIAQTRRLPVVLHCVRAFEPVMEILAGHTLPAVIFHGFTGSRQQSARAVAAGYYLSFGERSLASPKTVAAMKSVPLSNMFFETDESALSIGEIYRLAARAISGGDATPGGPEEAERYKKIMYDNYTKIFGE